MSSTHVVDRQCDTRITHGFRREPARVADGSVAAGIATVMSLALLAFAGGCAQVPVPHDGGHSVAQSEAEYYSDALAPWTYPEGPSWGTACAKAPPPQQSPIDLTRVTTTPWSASGVITQATFDAHDQNVVLQASPGPAVTMAPGIDGTGQALVYTVAGFHFHYRNEHVIAGNPAYELHIKTVDQHGGVAVFAVLWTADDGAREDPTLAAAYRSLSAPPDSVVAVDLGSALWRFGQQPFYSYVGSLTTPPCTTGIRWFVLQAPIHTSPSSISRLNSALVARGMPRNNVRTVRPIAQPQPVVYLVTPKK